MCGCPGLFIDHTMKLKNLLTWRELDLLIMYIADDPERFTQHISDFGYDQKTARKLQQNIQAKLTDQASEIIENQ